MKLYLYGRYFIYTDEPLFASHSVALEGQYLKVRSRKG